MLEQQYIRFGLILLLLVVLSGACSGNQDQHGLVIASQTKSVTTTIPNQLETPTNPVEPTTIPTGTALPSATPALSRQRVEVQAQLSDFVVPLPTPTASPLPQPTATLPLSPLSSSAPNPLIHETVVSTNCTYDAQFVADVTIPDDTTLPPGETFVKTWRLRNSGTCDWDAGLQLAFVAGDLMGGPSMVTVSPTLAGDTTDISVSLAAPQEVGTHQGHWELRAPDGHPIGKGVYVRIVVPSPATPTAALPPAPEVSGPRLMLLNYFAWYDENSWDGCNISAGDKPLQRYHSDDPATIARHIRMALDAGADGFTQQWFAPGDRTDRNFETLLAQSQGTAFRATVVFLRHIWPGSPAPTQANVAEALRYVLERYGGHSNFLTFEGKPVIFITDVYRVPVGGGQTPQQAWAAIRTQVDPGGNAWWIAEGLDPSYLAVFDGLWVYKITHATYPNAYLKASRWANGVRQWEVQTGKRKLWIATLTPGWDDLRAGCKADVRAPSTAHKQERAGGAFYRATFDAALGSNPNWLWVNSFNEWVEGTYIESSVLYGDLYMQITRELTALFKGQ